MIRSSAWITNDGPVRLGDCPSNAMRLSHTALTYLLGLLLSFSVVSLEAQGNPIWQMAHSSWRGHDGAPQGIDALAQTPDGFIWAAAGGRLFQFDGISFQQFEPPGGMPRGTYLDQMLVSKNGDLWCFQGHGAPFRIREGRIEVSRTGDNGAFDTTWTGAQDAEGRLFALQEDRRIVELGTDLTWRVTARYPPANGFVSDMAIGRNDVAWIVRDRRVYRFLPGHAKPVSTDVVVGVDTNLAPLADGSLWVMSRWAPTRELGRRLVSLQHIDATGKLLQPPLQVRGIDQILASSDGALWITAQNRGTWKIPASTSDLQKVARRESPIELPEDANFTADASGHILEAQDGSIWIGGNTGLDSYRPAKLAPALPSMHSGFWMLCAEPASDLVLADDTHSLFQVKGGFALPIRGYESNGLGGNLMCDRDGTTWISTPRRISKISNGALPNLPEIPTRAGVPVIYAGSSEENHQIVTAALLGPSLEQQLWLFRSGRWSRLLPDQIISRIYALHFDEDGSVYLSCLDGSLLVLQNGVLHAISGPAGTHGRVLGFTRTTYGLFAYARDGIFLIEDLHSVPLQFVNRTHAEDVSGLAQARNGDLWLVSGDGLINVPANDMKRFRENNSTSLSSVHLSEGDYVGPDDLLRFRRSAQTDRTGRIWFTLLQGVVSIDPERVFTDVPLPRVFIRSVMAGQSQLDAKREFPAGTSDLTIRFIGLLLSDPWAVKYRYMLEGADRSWRDASASTEASYSHLGPGSYRFKIMACNGLGSWTAPIEGETFRILPHVWETKWFELGMCALMACILWLGAHWRLERTKIRVRLLAEERAEERASIARELHDTLLQGVQGLLLTYSVVRHRIQQGKDASQLLDDSILQTEKLAVEARERIATVRRETPATDSLRQKLRSLCARSSEESGVEIPIEVAGVVRELLPSVSEELYFIAREALRNALIHADARKIQFSFHYGTRLFRLECQDNGVGFNTLRIDDGDQVRARWGLQGMAERAASIHAQLSICSQPGVGTHITIKLDAKYAYRHTGPV